jgi:hypothetical protein
MFDKTYFEKSFQKELERYKKETGVENPKVIFVCGNHHLVVNEIVDLKEDTITCWIYDGEYKQEGRSPVLMQSRYDQIRQILFYPLKGDHQMGFRIRK